MAERPGGTNWKLVGGVVAGGAALTGAYYLFSGGKLPTIPGDGEQQPPGPGDGYADILDLLDDLQAGLEDLRQRLEDLRSQLEHAQALGEEQARLVEQALAQLEEIRTTLLDLQDLIESMLGLADDLRGSLEEIRETVLTARAELDDVQANRLLDLIDQALATLEALRSDLDDARDLVLTLLEHTTTLQDALVQLQQATGALLIQITAAIHQVDDLLGIVEEMQRQLDELAYLLEPIPVSLRAVKAGNCGNLVVSQERRCSEPSRCETVQSFLLTYPQTVRYEYSIGTTPCIYCEAQAAVRIESDRSVLRCHETWRRNNIFWEVGPGKQSGSGKLALAPGIYRLRALTWGGGYQHASITIHYELPRFLAS